MAYIILTGLAIIALVYASFRAPFAKRVPKPVHWLLGVGLLFFIYLMGVWLEVLWLHANDQASSLGSMAWEQRGIVLLGAGFAGTVAFIYSVNYHGLQRGLLITAAALSGALSGLGIYSMWSMLFAANA